MGIKTETNRFGANIRFYSSKVIIGKNSFVNNGCYFHNYSSVSLGDNVFLGPEVMLTTVSHKIGDTTCRATALESAPITIQNGTWVGARAIILPGVTIGQGCIIGAGAVVSKDCEPNGLYAGVPAKKIKDLT
jgi:maltose O-acetyltransferase